MRNAEQEHACDCCKTVPVSHLALDEPIGGWSAFFAERGIEVVEDDLGRVAIRREDARALVEERREWELKSEEEARQRQEEMARKAPPTTGGVPYPENADSGMSAYEVMRAAAGEEADPNRRVSPQEEFLMQRLGRPWKVEVTEK